MVQKSNSEFDEYKKEISASVKKAAEKIEKEKQARKYVKISDYLFVKIKKELASIIEKIFKSAFDTGEIEIGTPPEHIKADFVFESFSLAGRLKQKPDEIAEKIAGMIQKSKLKYIKSASVIQAFINIHLNRKVVYEEIFASIDGNKEYGHSDISAKKVAIIDYSAPNIAKPIGIAHARSTIIGQALSNIYDATGYSVIRDNHLGDWGTQFGSLMYAYNEWGDEKKILKNPVRKLKNLYVKFNDEAKQNPKLKDNARELFKKLEQKDPKLIKLWKRFRDLSVGDFEKIYDKLGIKFDLSIGESYFIDEIPKIVDDCLKKKACSKDEKTGAVVVGAIKGLPSFLLLKQDASSLYITRDLAALKFRVDVFKPNVILYVVGQEQELNFKQLFKLAEKVGYLAPAVSAKHIGFGLILKEGKKMSTRKGAIIELDDLIRQSIEKSRKIIKKKNPDFKKKNLDNISEVIGIGAVIYNDLRQSRTKNISFDWDRMLDFEGGSAVYLQYTYVRINSILKKINEDINDIDFGGKANAFFVKDIEFALAKKIMLFPEIIIKAQKTDSPHYIATYLEELARDFNGFYSEVQVIKTDDLNLKKSRINLIKSAALVIKNGLNLLNIKVPDKM